MSLATMHQITVRRLSGADRFALEEEEMDARFVPPGEALGLPPRDPERRRARPDLRAGGVQFVCAVPGK